MLVVVVVLLAMLLLLLGLAVHLELFELQLLADGAELG